MESIPDKNSQQHHDTLDAMEHLGGGFIVALAKAWRKADYANHARLYQVFGHDYVRYAQAVAMRQANTS